jgi:predicted nucleic acid-binding protein
LIVLDASAVIELLLNTDNGALVRSRIADRAESLHAPHLLSVEVAQVLRRYVASRSIKPEIAVAALDDLAVLDIAHYAHEPFLPRAWALRDNVTVYDAVYLVLAEVLDAPLLTLDRRLANSPGHQATVELIAGDRS